MTHRFSLKTMRKSMRAASIAVRAIDSGRAQVRTDERWFLCDGQPGEYSE
jgi:hypothetical protein